MRILQAEQWVKLLLSKYRGADKTLQRITVRPVCLRDMTMLSFVYSYQTRDITKNATPEEGLQLIRDLLAADFKAAHLYTTEAETQLDVSKKGKVTLHTRMLPAAASHTLAHNREKNRFVDSSRPFLTALGITDAQQRVIPSMARKWKQINKFIEVFAQAFGHSPLAADQPVRVVDFGCGKGYLTFALHDYLHHVLHNAAEVTGVELREELVALCNTAAEKLDYTGLAFVCGDVKTHAPKNIDVMIALHACDTATDYAIHYGIRAQAAIIMCSPCCHKQLRPQMHSPMVLQSHLQFGVHLGQEAEMLTDTLRALLLEANGYEAKVFEFVSLEHTNKNKMILAVKRQGTQDVAAVLQQIAALKDFYGVTEHCLEGLLRQPV